MPELCRFLEATEPFEFSIGTDAEGQPIVLKMRAYVERIRDTERDAKGKTKPSKWAELKKRESDLIQEQIKLVEDTTKQAQAVGDLKPPDEPTYQAFRNLVEAKLREPADIAVEQLATALRTFDTAILPDNTEVEARQKALEEATEAATKRIDAIGDELTHNYAQRVAYLTQWWDLTVEGEMYPITADNILAQFRPERIREILVAFQKKAQG